MTMLPPRVSAGAALTFTLTVLAATAGPAAADTVRVTSTAALRAALDGAAGHPGRVIEIAPGTYDFDGGVLAHLGAPKAGAVAGLTVRGMGETPSDVVLRGTGMEAPAGEEPAAAGRRGRGTGGTRATSNGFILSRATDVVFENFTIRDVRIHLFHLKGENGADRVTFRRLRLVNSGQQFIKGTAKRWEKGVDDSLVEDCVFEYELRTAVDRNRQRARAELLERVGPAQVRVRSFRGIARNAWPENFWAGGRASAKGSDWRGAIVSNRAAEGTTAEQIITFSAPVPEGLDATWTLELDQADDAIEGAWGPSGGYTNAIDIHTGRNWVVRRSAFVRIGTSLRSNHDHAVPSVLFWNGSRDTLVERVAFLNCESGVVLGLGQRTGAGTEWNHANGVVRHAWFFRDPGVKGDRAFAFENSVDARIEDAVIVLNGTYRSAVEYRFAQTRGFVAKGVRADAAVTARATETQAPETAARVEDPEAVRRVVVAAASGTPVPGTDTPLDEWRARAAARRTAPAAAASGAADATAVKKTPKEQRQERQEERRRKREEQKAQKAGTAPPANPAPVPPPQR
jgi:hypothetical protein